MARQRATHLLQQTHQNTFIFFLWAEWAAYERGYTLNNTHAAIRPILEEGAVNFYGCVGQMEKRRQRTQVTNLEYVDESGPF